MKRPYSHVRIMPNGDIFLTDETGKKVGHLGKNGMLKGIPISLINSQTIKTKNMEHKNKIILQGDGRCALWQLKRFLIFFKVWEYVGEFTSIQDALDYLYGED